MIGAAAFSAALAAQTQAPAPAWQKRAGGALQFSTSSVKRDASGVPPTGDRPASSVPLTAEDVRVPAGNEFSSTNFPLLAVIGYAFKLSSAELRAIPAQLPRWAMLDRFDIKGQASGDDLNDDQLRLMVQSLLRQRFKLAVHYKFEQQAVLALTLAVPGKLGPQLKPHAEGSPCFAAMVPRNSPADPPPLEIRRGGFPQFPTICGGLAPFNEPLRAGARNVAMEQIATLLSAVDSMDRPLSDQTGLEGAYDFIIEFEPRPGGRPSLADALLNQLGLKLEERTAPVSVLVIDHVEEPAN